MQNRRVGGVSVDAIMLTVIKLITAALGLVTTRLLSEYLTVYDYGTYSQIFLIVSTVSSLTIFGMMDGMNYFYCGEKDEDKKEAYVATIFSIQSIVGIVAGFIVVLLGAPLCQYFDNPEIKRLIIFAAIFPLLHNFLGIFQILLVSVGKARMLALRNFVISVLRLGMIFAVVFTVRNVAVILLFTLLLDIGQVLFLWAILRKSNCYIRLPKTDFHLLGKIFRYCAPMATFILVNSLNRDMDKYMISLLTDTETLALYANASKQLPFDVIMASFCTVLIPHITRYISEQCKEKAANLYRLFLEITYITTGIFCFAALAAAPQLMQLLYSNKYSGGLTIFCIYILVDLFRFTNITLVLSASGKTRLLMLMGFGSMAINAILNLVLYNALGIVGPAVATLCVTIFSGILMLHFGAKILDVSLFALFDFKYLMLFVVENVVFLFGANKLRLILEEANIYPFFILAITAGVYGGVMLLVNGKRLLRLFKNVNHVDAI